MNENQLSVPAKDDVQQTRDSIRQSWSHAERNKRRRIAATRQRFLFGVLLQPQATVPARVA